MYYLKINFFIFPSSVIRHMNGITANTLLKTGVILVLGSSRFRLRAASALIVLGLASGMVLWWCW